MSETPVLQRIAEAHAGIAAGLPGGPAWAERRAQALAALLERGLPDRRDENWKYLDHRQLGQREALPAAGAAPDAAALETLLLLPLTGLPRVVLVDGRFEPALSTAEVPGVTVTGLRELLAADPAAATRLLRRPDDSADERYALLADAFAGDGVVIRVADGAGPTEPLYLVHVATVQGTSQARIVVEAGTGARLQLVEHFVCTGAPSGLANLVMDLRLAGDANVGHLRVHQQDPAAAQVETLSVAQQAGSQYLQQLFVLGGGTVRSNLAVSLDGAGAGCRLAGLFMADDRRQADLYTRVDHRAPQTRSEQDFRGIAAGRGRGAYNGRVIVHAGARGADSSQTSRNLLLSPQAELHARPQLEIHTDEVQCRHGATTGSLDPSQLFYLLSRGIDPGTARALLTFAFCEDIVAGVLLPSLRPALEELVVGRLPDRDLIRSFR